MNLLELNKVTGLTPDSTLAEIEYYDFQVNLETPGDVVLEIFRTHNQIPGVIVSNGEEIVAVISQKKFLEHMSKLYSLELYLKRPIQALLNILRTEFLQLPIACTIVQAVQIALSRPSKLVYEPILVQSQRQVGLLDIQTLLLAQSQILTEVNLLREQQQQQTQKYLEQLERQQAQLQRSQEKLRESEQRYRRLVEMSPETIAVYSQGKFDYINRAGAKLFGAATSKEIIGKPLKDFAHPTEQQLVSSQMQQLQVAGNQIAPIEQKFVRKDGQEIDVEVTGIPVTYSGKAAVQLVIRDITSRKQAETAQVRALVAEAAKEELSKALAKERELRELKSRFVTMTSHEFRTPLTTILSSAELLQDYGDKWTQEKKLQHLERIQTAVKHMTELLNDVLLIGQAEAGKLQYNPAPLDLVQLCHNLVDELQSTTSNHTITNVCIGDCGNAILDEKLIRHILSNLLSNAIKYSPKGGKVHLECVCTQEAVMFHVQDRGIGIPIADQARLFDPFQRASNVGTISGTGLGLAIVKKAVELHGGNITVNSELGVGTTFTVTLKLNRQI